ncbi:MAG: MMPL family transporter, partial [Thermoleophilia bacterium]|nr:MMPL family transporter [Thermoleophilia bacterium]
MLGAEMFAALGRFAYRFRWLVIGLWVLLFAVALIATPYLGQALQGSGFANPHAPSQEAARLIEERFGQGATTVLIVFQSSSLEATGADFQALQRKALTAVQEAGIPGLESIQTYADTGSDLLLSRDQKSAVAVLNFSTAMSTVQRHVPDIRAALAASGACVLADASESGTSSDQGAAQTAGSSSLLRAYVTGEPAINADLVTYSFRDLRRVELYGLPVALVALLFVFGSLVAAALPVVTGGLAVTVTLGCLYLVAQVTNISIFAMNTASLLGLAVAIDYALFIV